MLFNAIYFHSADLPRLQQEEMKFRAQHQSMQATEEQLSVMVSKEESHKKDLAHVISEREAMKARLQSATESLEEVKHELEARKDR